MTILAEQDYIDRDFLEDHASYYVSCFLGKYSPVCSRLHFFRSAFTLDEFRAAVDGDEHGDLAVAALKKAYLGFLVLKPLPSTFIGRTCLATYSDEARRHFPVTRTYKVHVAGVELEVVSLAFQQQDTVAAACATSALWSIFHGTGVLFHHAIPSPTQITKTATEGIWTRGVTVQAPEKVDHLDRLQIGDRQMDSDVIYVIVWIGSDQSASSRRSLPFVMAARSGESPSWRPRTPS